MPGPRYLLPCLKTLSTTSNQSRLSRGLRWLHTSCHAVRWHPSCIHHVMHISCHGWLVMRTSCHILCHGMHISCIHRCRGWVAYIMSCIYHLQHLLSSVLRDLSSLSVAAMADQRPILPLLGSGGEEPALNVFIMESSF
jgi:hypothetical protein